MCVIDNVAAGVAYCCPRKRPCCGRAWKGGQRFKTGGVRKRLALRYVASGAAAQSPRPTTRAALARAASGAERSIDACCAESVSTRALY